MAPQDLAPQHNSVPRPPAVAGKGSTIIELVDVTKVFTRGRPNEFTAVDGVSLRVRAHETTGLVGPSGSGKTTLAGLIGCMARPTSGRILLRPDNGTDRLEGLTFPGGEVTSLPERFLKAGHNVVEMIGGRKVHPCTSIPGGLTKGITEEQRQEIEALGRWAVEFAQFSLKLFSDIVLGNEAYVDLIVGDVYTHRTYYMGMVDEKNRVNFYDGKVRVVDPEGKEYVKYAPADYAQHIAEHVEPWTCLKFPYLKNVGWKGFVDGAQSGVYCATPLSPLNAADGMATPLAQEEYERSFSTLGGKPVHQRLAPLGAAC